MHMYHEENILYIQAYYKVTERVLLHLWLLLLWLPDIGCYYVYPILTVAMPISQGIPDINCHYDHHTIRHSICHFS